MKKIDKGRGDKFTYTISDLVDDLVEKKDYIRKEATMVARDVLDLISKAMISGNDISFNQKFSILLRLGKCTQMARSMYRTNKEPLAEKEHLASKVYIGRKPFFKVVLPRSVRRNMLHNTFISRTRETMLSEEEEDQC